MSTHVDHTLCINGIRGKPSLADSWTDRRARHIELRTPNKAKAVENSFWFVRSRKRLNHYAAQLAKEIRAYNEAGVQPNIEAHSNGNVLVCMALKLDPYLKIGRFIMLFPAADASFEANGLNQALRTGQVHTVHFVGSKSDRTVKWGGRATKWLKPLGYGYGTLSYTGPQEVAYEVRTQVRQTWKNQWPHSHFATRGVLNPFLDSLYQAPAL